MSYTIETLKELKTNEIALAIRNKAVNDEVLEKILYTKKLPTRKFKSPVIFNAILHIKPCEDLAVNALEKLIEKNKAGIEDYLSFFDNPNISKDTFNKYLSFVDTTIIYFINQADFRIDIENLARIINEQKENPYILLNPNLTDELRDTVIKRNIEKMSFQEVFAKMPLKETEIDLLVSFLKNEDVLADLLTYNSINAKQAKLIVKNPKLKYVSSVLKEYLKEKVVEANVAKIIINAIKEDLSYSDIIVILSKNPHLLKVFGLNDFDELFNKVDRKEIFIYHPVKFSNQLIKSLIAEFKEFKISNDYNQAFKDVEYFEKIGRIIAIHADSNILFDLMKINNKKYTSIDLTVLSRKDFVVTKEVVDYLLPDEEYGCNERELMIIDNNMELPFFYNRGEIFSFLVNSNLTNEARKAVLDYIYRNKKIGFEDRYVLTLKDDFKELEKLFKKVDEVSENSDGIKYGLLHFNLEKNTCLSVQTLKKVTECRYFNNPKYAIHTIFNGYTLLIAQKNAPDEILMEYILKGKIEELLLYRKEGLSNNLLLKLIKSAKKEELRKLLYTSRFWNKNNSKEVMELLLFHSIDLADLKTSCFIYRKLQTL